MSTNGDEKRNADTKAPNNSTGNPKPKFSNIDKKQTVPLTKKEAEEAAKPPVYVHHGKSQTDLDLSDYIPYSLFSLQATHPIKIARTESESSALSALSEYLRTDRKTSKACKAAFLSPDVKPQLYYLVSAVYEGDVSIHYSVGCAVFGSEYVEHDGAHVEIHVTEIRGTTDVLGSKSDTGKEEYYCTLDCDGSLSDGTRYREDITLPADARIHGYEEVYATAEIEKQRGNKLTEEIYQNCCNKAFREKEMDMRKLDLGGAYPDYKIQESMTDHRSFDIEYYLTPTYVFACQYNKSVYYAYVNGNTLDVIVYGVDSSYLTRKVNSCNRAYTSANVICHILIWPIILFTYYKMAVSYEILWDNLLGILDGYREGGNTVQYGDHLFFSYIVPIFSPLALLLGCSYLFSSVPPEEYLYETHFKRIRWFKLPFLAACIASVFAIVETAFVSIWVPPRWPMMMAGINLEVGPLSFLSEKIGQQDTCAAATRIGGFTKYILFGIAGFLAEKIQPRKHLVL